MNKHAHLLIGVMIVASSSFLSIASQGKPLNHDTFCKGMEMTARDINARGPHWSDAFTRTDGANVDCSRKLFEMKRYSKATSSQLRVGWQALFENQWNYAYCRPPTLRAIKADWVISQVTTFADGYVHRMHARCGGN